MSSSSAGLGSDEDIASWRGVVFVVEGLTWLLIKAGTRLVVTLSMNVNAGSSSTVLDGSPSIIGEPSGTGMLDAESIIFWNQIFNNGGSEGIRRKETGLPHLQALSHPFQQLP